MKKIEVKFKVSVCSGSKTYKKGEIYLLSLKDAQNYVNKGMVVSESIERILQERKEVLYPKGNFEEVLVTGSIGDWLAIQYFLPKDLEIKKFYMATQSIGILKPIIRLVYPNAEIIEIYKNWKTRFCLYHKAELTTLISAPKGWENVKDLSIFTLFPEIMRKEWNFEPECKLLEKTQTISVELPKNFIVIVPDSEHKFVNRDFSKSDWGQTLAYLKKKDITGVILRKSGTQAIPKTPYLLDLTGQTTFLETMEIMKKASGYIGIDSCLSVIASKLPYKVMKVKTINKHLLSWQQIYYAPRTKFNFIADKIKFS